MIRTLQTVHAFAAAGPFTENQLRWYIFQSAHNGMDAHGVVLRVGRRVYIDVDAFERWIDAQSARTRIAA